MLLTLGAFINTSLFAQDYKIAETGQMSCYDEDRNAIDFPVVGDSLYGQDAQYTGFEIALVDNGDGTVTDEVTGLMWQQVPVSDSYTYYQAIEYCEDLKLAGYDDWRLPNLKELFSIGNFNSGWPYLDQDFFSLANPGISKDEQYWSNVHYVGVTVECGPLGEGGERYYNYVRLVRNITSTGVEESYFENGNFKIYPNPTYDQINVAGDSEITELYIFDLTGKTVLEYTPNSTFCTLDLSSLNNGFYILRADCADNTAIAKTIIKQ